MEAPDSDQLTLWLHHPITRWFHQQFLDRFPLTETEIRMVQSWEEANRLKERAEVRTWMKEFLDVR